MQKLLKLMHNYFPMILKHAISRFEIPATDLDWIR